MTTPHIYEFKFFRFDPSEHSLLRNGTPVALTEKAFQVLTVLVERSGHLVERSELVNAVWGDTFIEEGNLTVTISMLRKALGDDRGENKFIETVAKRGYRFLPAVTRLPVDCTIVHEAIPVEPHSRRVLPWRVPVIGLRFLTARPGRLAFLVFFPIAAGLFAKHAPSRAKALNTPSHVQRFVAVAPFTLTGSSATDPHVGTDVASDLVGRFAKRKGLRARSVAEMSRYSQNSGESDADKGTAEVAALLTGLVDVRPGETRVSAKLANAKGETIWSGSYSSAPGEIKYLEDQIESTVNARMLDLSSAAQPMQPGRDIEAQRLYLAGRYFWNERTELGLRRGIECFQQAIIRDPDFAEAYAGLADSYALLASYSVEPPSEAYPNAKAAARKALQLNPNLAEGHTALGMVALYYEWNWKDAKQEFKKAIDLSPEYAASYAWDSLYFAAVGDTSQALQQALKAQEIDPLSMAAIMHLASAYYWDRQFDKAEGTYRYALAQNADFARAHSRLGIVLAAERDYAGALREFRETERLSGSDPYTDGLIGYAEALRGNGAAARKILDELNTRSAHEYIPAFSRALLYLGLGNKDMALDWLERARKDRSTYLVYAKVDPLLDPLRSDRRFNLLLANMELSVQKPDHPDDAPASAQMAEISLVR